jgi:signal transduction protein with GAF and PtsI domain
LNHHNSTQPPWNFLLSATRNTLQSYELSRLSHAANVRKEIAQLLDVYLEESANAMLARCLMERPEELPAEHSAQAASEATTQAPPTVSDNFLAERSADLSEGGMLPPRLRGVLRRRACA